MLLSRTAHCMYWLNRYLERAENQTRLIESHLGANVEGGLKGEKDSAEFLRLLTVTGDLSAYQERVMQGEDLDVLRFTVFDRTMPNSLLSCIIKARDNAKQIRDLLTTDLWEIVNHIYWMVEKADGESGDIPFALFKEIRQSYCRFVGALDTGFFRDELWHVARLGQLIERADHVSRILDGFYMGGSWLGNEEERALDLLKSCDAVEMYRRVHRGLVPKQILLFLAHNLAFPRSLRYCLSEAEKALLAVVEQMDSETQCESLQLLNHLEFLVQKWNFRWSGEDAPRIQEAMDTLQKGINSFDRKLYEEFFYAPFIGTEVSLDVNTELLVVWGAAQ